MEQCRCVARNWQVATVGTLQRAQHLHEIATKDAQPTGKSEDQKHHNDDYSSSNSALPQQSTHKGDSSKNTNHKVTPK
jgi:hypothetical protein